ncbi:MAG: DUF6338 family protein, partial [Chloroflexales bacterium]|nr:DUF6338 family protein [Chloroflexales bacterium]
MNLALPALVISLALLPGYVFFYTYNGRVASFDGDVVVGDPKFGRSFVIACAFSLLLHTVFITLATTYAPAKPDLSFLFYLLSGDYSDGGIKALAKEKIADSYYWIVAYLVVSFIGALLFGLALRSFVSRLNLDSKYGLLRFSNDWHYILTGASTYDPPPTDTLIVASVEFPLATYLYAGVLYDYSVSTDGRLRDITLLRASRRKLEDDRKLDLDEFEYPGDGGVDGHRFYPLTGEFIVLDMGRVQTLVVDYFWLYVPDDFVDDIT